VKTRLAALKYKKPQLLALSITILTMSHESWVKIDPTIDSSLTQSAAPAKTLRTSEKVSGGKISASGSPSMFSDRSIRQ
jgi:hypothetical protein